ncbi:hypothetical protein PAXINDRAFT_169567, partial [Paxillus involutus ATCC 200175]
MSWAKVVGQETIPRVRGNNDIPAGIIDSLTTGLERSDQVFAAHEATTDLAHRHLVDSRVNSTWEKGGRLLIHDSEI